MRDLDEPSSLLTTMGSRLATTIAILLIMVSTGPLAHASDADGDGEDDSTDAFPNDPCASMDYDGDGLPDDVETGCTGFGIVAFTSFEEPLNGTQYTDTGDNGVSRLLWNNPGESHVAHNASGTGEIGFRLHYESTGRVGLTDGDYFGTVEYTGTVGSFTEGQQGYQMSDVDGISTLILDPVDAEIVQFDLYVQQKLTNGVNANWETSDSISVWYEGANSVVSILNTTGTDIDTAYAGLLGTWTTFTVNVTGSGVGSLKFSLESNAITEAIYVDNVTFSGGTTLLADTDDDNDGWSDEDEADCGTDPLDSGSVPSDGDSNGICDFLEGGDTDGDGIPDLSDDDDDGDGFSDLNEEACGSDSKLGSDIPADMDEDGECDAEDIDIDGDDWSNDMEYDCGSDPLDNSSVPYDMDDDGLADCVDDDDDGDGIGDDVDLFPNDPFEWEDSDSDGLGDNTDLDDDNDGVNDTDDAYPNDPSESGDNDGDGTGDNADSDDDTCPTAMVCGEGFYPGDGVTDSIEVDCNSDPFDPISVPGDSDGDGVCDYMDQDLDNDGAIDADDSFPNDPCAYLDTDNDSLPDFILTDCDTDLVEDEDDDDDGWSDQQEDVCESESDLASITPQDTDSDGTCNSLDQDDDGDGFPDEGDAFPLDASENSDLDSDGIGDVADFDDDGDGWPDEKEQQCGSDPVVSTSVPSDTDNDSICDELDVDMDGDGFPNDGDDFPEDNGEWSDLDGDGTGDNQDVDDDGDGWSDLEEVECGYDPNDLGSTPPDSDGDLICDYLDPSPLDGAEGDGLPGFGILAVLSSILIAGVAAKSSSRR